MGSTVLFRQFIANQSIPDGRNVSATRLIGFCKCDMPTDICYTLSSFLSSKYQLPSRLYGDSLQVNVTPIWIFPVDLLNFACACWVLRLLLLTCLVQLRQWIKCHSNNCKLTNEDCSLISLIKLSACLVPNPDLNQWHFLYGDVKLKFVGGRTRKDEERSMNI